MKIPIRIPFLRAATLLGGVYALVWVALEGRVGWDGLLAGWGMAVLALWLVGRAFGGRELSVGRFVALGAAVGLAWGVALGPAVLLLMAVKTGLHAHGPAYTAADLAWVWTQLPWWAGVGTLAGVGISLVVLGLRRR